MGSTISKVPVISWKWVKTYFLEITGFAGFTGTFCGFPGWATIVRPGRLLLYKWAQQQSNCILNWGDLQ